MNGPTLPPAFQTQMQTQLGPDYPAFANALAQPAPVSIRLNPHKPGFDRTGLDPVSWCAEGVYLPQRPVFTLDPLFQAGAYYVQEASSMLLAEVLRQIQRPGQPMRTLDLCAAPGGKTTLLATALPPHSLLLANEVIRSRVPVLRENVDKWGLPNVAVSNHDPDAFSGMAGYFDLVLIDAPCSGEGLFRKDPDAVAQWSPEQVMACAARQQRILHAALPLVREGGWLIYSTCTYNETENMANVRHLTERGFVARPLAFPADWGAVELGSGSAVGYQCFPHRVRGEGLFLSLLQNMNRTTHTPKIPRLFRSIRALRPRETAALQPWLRVPDAVSLWEKPNGEVVGLLRSQEKDMLIVDSALYSKGFGTVLGQFKGTDFIPAHAFALSTLIHPDRPAVDLSLEDALRYFKKENLVLDQPTAGWTLARFGGQNLGWMKGLGHRINNYLPKDWRIRMDLKTEFFD
jgi:16S rRNA C967 or C1407 C5-methylase (RsmB/RsmF family)/NOL1/NOP2/fmu family ribosome biogenesis protein